MAASVLAKATSFEQAVCYDFGGQAECRTVRVVDAEERIIKVYLQPLSDLELDVAVCLRDEVQTKKVYFWKMKSRNFVVTEQIRVLGMSTVEVVVRHDGHGAAVWRSEMSTPLR